MVKKLAIIIFLILTYTISWVAMGQESLYEKSLSLLVEENLLEFHKKPELVIIPKYEGKNILHKFKTCLPNKIIKTITNKEDEKSFYESLPKKNNDKNGIEIYGIVIRITENNLFYSKVDFQIIRNDIISPEHLFIWGFFGWISIY